MNARMKLWTVSQAHTSPPLYFIIELTALNFNAATNIHAITSCICETTNSIHNLCVFTGTTQHQQRIGRPPFENIYILCIVFQLVRLEIDRLEFVSARTALIRVRKKCVEKHKCMTLALTFALKLLRCPSLLCTLCIYEIVCIFFPFLNVTLILFCFCIVFILSVGRFYLFNVLQHVFFFGF